METQHVVMPSEESTWITPFFTGQTAFERVTRIYCVIEAYFFIVDREEILRSLSLRKNFKPRPHDAAIKGGSRTHQNVFADDFVSRCLKCAWLVARLVTMMYWLIITCHAEMSVTYYFGGGHHRGAKCRTALSLARLPRRERWLYTACHPTC